MKVFSEKVYINSGASLGGYEANRTSSSKSTDLEINGIEFYDKETNLTYDIISIDSLYAGDLALLQEPNNRKLFAASHTHYAPMLDRYKPQIGAVDENAIKSFSTAITKAMPIDTEIDTCRIYTAEAPTPVYRRFDFPNTVINRFLSRRGAMYPNEKKVIDKKIYIFQFSFNQITKFTIIYHACHPVSRSDRLSTSADYIGALRIATKDRFGEAPCLFFQGCSGDIRPNIACKRFPILPRCRINWRFKRSISMDEEMQINNSYKKSIKNAALTKTIALESDSSFKFKNDTMRFKNHSDINIPSIVIGNSISFEFWPFEVSHLFHLERHRKDHMNFIVSCADHNIGYLPHPKQLSAGGYEVDGSRGFSGLSNRIELLEKMHE